MYELLIEKTETGYRATIFDVEADGTSTAWEVMETSEPWMRAVGVADMNTSAGRIEDVTFADAHSEVDLTGLNSFRSQVKKICNSL